MIKNSLLTLALIFVLSYREVQILIDRGSWKAHEHLNIFWYTQWDGTWKLWDSFHVANGLIVLIILEMIVHYLPKYTFRVQHWLMYQAWVIIYWVIFMQIRNLFMNLL